MTRPELMTLFRQIQLLYAAPLVHKPVPDATEPRVCARDRDNLHYLAALAGVRISDREPQFNPGQRGMEHLGFKLHRKKFPTRVCPIESSSARDPGSEDTELD